MIRVRQLSGDQYEVTVELAETTTDNVTLRDAERVRLAGKDVSAERLIEESFRFLVEREPNTSILPSFDLSSIVKYFAEYEREIRTRVT